MTQTLILGGQKSGKSSRAASLAAQTGLPVVVIAPALARDDAELARRIERHRRDRPRTWTTIETFDVVATLASLPATSAVIVDALDTWLLEQCFAAGVMGPVPDDDEAHLQERGVLAAVDELARAASSCAHAVFVVAGQPGSGLVAMTPESRRYVDLHGLATQRLAAAARSVELMVAGRALEVPADRPAAPPPAAQQLGGGSVAVARARERLLGIAAPPGSLGRLGELAVRLSGIAQTCPPPPLQRPALLVAAGDHGVHRQGVSMWPQALSAVIADAVAGGRSVAAVLAAQLGVRVAVVDVGLSGELPPQTSVIARTVRRAAGDITCEAAMTSAEVAQALAAGERTAVELIEQGADLLALGEVGIANTTPSAALIAACTGQDARDVVGPGAGADQATQRRKVAAVQQALARCEAHAAPETLLAALGGLEHAALVGALSACALRSVPVVLDGVSTLAAALIAVRMRPEVAGCLVAGHRSPEPGASIALAALGLEPVLDLGLRLGEGSGALLAVPIVQAAAEVLRSSATLEELTPPSRGEGA